MVTDQTLSQFSYVNIRKPTANDLDGLVNINQDWYKPNLPNIEHGFLSVTYDRGFFQKVIENDDLLIFGIQDKILGYVLVNTVIETPHINKIKGEYLLTKPENTSSTIAFSYQILIDTQLQGTGFFYYAQPTYLEYFKTKYEIFVSTVSKENTRSIFAHKKANWNFIDTPHHYYIIEKKLG